MDNHIRMDELFYLATFPLLAWIIHYFFRHFFVCRVRNKLNLAIFYALYFGCHTILHISSWPSSVLLVTNTALIILLSSLYRGSLKWRISAALFLVALIMLSDVVIQAVIQPIFSVHGYIISLFLSKLLMFMLAYVSIRTVHAFGEGNLSGWYWLLLLCVPLVSVLGMVQITNHLFFRTYHALIPAISLGLLIINFLMLMLCDRILCVQSALNRSQQLELQMTYYTKQYEWIQERHEATSRLQHDFKNILLGLKAQLKSNEESKVIREINEVLGEMENTAGLCNSGNMIIDSIINYKAQIAKNHDIPFHIDLNIPPQLELDTIVISVILGNALDNAIHASIEKVNVEPYIKLQMHYLNGSLFMRFQNPYVHEILTNRQGDFYSTKPDAHSRLGLGIKNIKKIVDDNYGLVDISYRNHLFELEIVLFHVRKKASKTTAQQFLEA
ncbi:GHKL domain-containing protein [Paenibacillus lentus]|uniref:GHKL domain-containing protein n=1 Tax=Paenibacillus lentus TaxID=1338368 RepID=UPI003668D7ED